MNKDQVRILEFVLLMFLFYLLLLLSSISCFLCDGWSIFGFLASSLMITSLLSIKFILLSVLITNPFLDHMDKNSDDYLILL